MMLKEGLRPFLEPYKANLGIIIIIYRMASGPNQRQH
jgi:hypothetical protein